jgi:hypothetical protein
MKLELAQALADEIEGAEVDKRYSGRGMYGSETAAVITPERLGPGRIAEAVLEVQRWHSLDESVIAEVSRLREDSMGMGSVIY